MFFLFLFLCSCAQSCVCISASSRSHVILVFAGGTGASSAGGTDVTALLEKHMQVTSISGILQQEDVQPASCPTSKFSCVITVSIPRPAGVKHDWEHTSKTVISLTVNHRIVYESTFFVREQFEKGNRSALTWWRQRNHHVFAAYASPCGDTHVVVTRPKERESTDYALVWSLVLVVGKPGPSIGARTRTWAEVKVRPRPLSEREQARRQN